MSAGPCLKKQSELAEKVLRNMRTCIIIIISYHMVFDCLDAITQTDFRLDASSYYMYYSMVEWSDAAGVVLR